MAYEAKTNWKLDDTVMPNDMNRIEQGIKDVESELGNVNGIIILEASTDNVIDFNTLTNEGIYLIKNCTTDTTFNGSSLINATYAQTVILQVSYAYKDGALYYVYQRAILGNRTTFHKRQTTIGDLSSWGDWSGTDASEISAGTLGGQVKANATAVTTLGTAQVRNIMVSTTDLTAGTSTLTTGNIYLVYE